eukprot:CAMPEP_0113934606 /NCGR_PEP_ID=MMETSP1339-20121228/1916_1 /TAXON_ID=94617 /ORGANISM="Fibrocapsa japonica" /LENGTH=118 /DNA_ID=CAMNT_0000936477 /DNA_START=87 /DNA_END=443 /DNA_ORIENTATION=- /assembly_acc=CAM_ASM_000762
MAFLSTIAKSSLSKTLAGKAVKPALLSQTRTIFASSPEEAEGHMEEWYKYSLGMAGLTAVSCVVIAVKEMGHEHHHSDFKPAYMKIRNKAYWWECDDCDYLDLDCHKKCQEAKKALDG